MSLIRLENIISPPFQAVWEGISAFPWAGPPPVDARGFLSIMYESTTNPEIGLTSEFDFGVQNHILLSRSYVSLSSRFGYHFVTIEALVGERARENFVSFQFRGGAAEVTRRTRRIRFVSGILAEFGFSMEAREDALMARVEGLPMPELMDRLKILGYLIIHTRQMPQLRLGVSPRGGLSLVRACQSLAAANGRGFVVADDVKTLATSVLSHRMLLTPDAELEGVSADDLIRAALAVVPVPQERSA